jgi:hypothetical protein
MAAASAQHNPNTRQAGQLYTAWRSGTPAIRKRLLDDPALFFKTQRPAEPKATALPAVELARDLEMAAALVNRATRRRAGVAAVEIDPQTREAARQQIARLQNQPGRLGRSKSRMLSRTQRL